MTVASLWRTGESERLLEAARTGGAAIEIFSCWEGDQDVLPEKRLDITEADLTDPGFEFEELHWYRVI